MMVFEDHQESKKKKKSYAKKTISWLNRLLKSCSSKNRSNSAFEPNFEEIRKCRPYVPVHRVLVLGERGVGKSALILQYLYQETVKKYEASTCDAFCEILQLNNAKMMVMVDDVTGHYECSDRMNRELCAHEAFLLVYDATNVDTFERVVRFRQQILTVKGPFEPIPMLVVGTGLEQSNAEHRSKVATIRTQCDEWNIPHYLTRTDQWLEVAHCFELLLVSIEHAKIAPKHAPNSSKQSLSITSNISSSSTVEAKDSNSFESDDVDINNNHQTSGSHRSANLWEKKKRKTCPKMC